MISLSDLKFRLFVWLAPPGFVDHVSRLIFFTEAIHDLHMVPLPYNEYTLEMAFQNAKAFESELISGRATIQDRQASLVEVFRRSQ